MSDSAHKGEENAAGTTVAEPLPGAVGGDAGLLVPGRFVGTKDELTDQVHYYCHQLGVQYRIRKSDKQKVHYVCATNHHPTNQRKGDFQVDPQGCQFSIRAGFHTKDNSWYISKNIALSHTCLVNRESAEQSLARRRKRSITQATPRKAFPDMSFPSTPAVKTEVPVPPLKRTVSQYAGYHNASDVEMALSTAKEATTTANNREAREWLKLTILTYDGWLFGMPRMSKSDRIEEILGRFQPPSTNVAKGGEDSNVPIRLCLRCRNQEFTTGNLAELEFQGAATVELLPCLEFSVIHNDLVVKLMLAPTDTVSLLKERLVGRLRIAHLRPDDFRVHQSKELSDAYLEDRETLANCNVTNGCTLWAETCFSIHYQRTDVPIRKTVRVFGTDDVPTVKRMIRAREGIPPKKVKLTLEGCKLDDSFSLLEHNVTPDSVLELEEESDSRSVEDGMQVEEVRAAGEEQVSERGSTGSRLVDAGGGNTPGCDLWTRLGA